MEQKRIAALLYPGCLSLDLIGPLEALNYVNMERHPDRPYDIKLCAQSTGPVDTLSGIQLVADTALADLTDVHTLLIPGMLTGDLRYRELGIVDWVRSHAPSIRRIASVCSGALISGEAGLLDGRSVTTHWMDSGNLQALVPTAHVTTDRIYVKDGNVYSSGGVTAGIDLALALIEEDFDRQTALKVAKRMIVPLQRAGNQSQFSELLLSQEKTVRFAPLLQWIEENLQADLCVNSMAEHASMSARNFSRRFSEDIGMPPMQFVRLRRLERAKLLLEQSNRPLNEIARLSGFGSGDKLRRQFDQMYGVGPKEYRARFGAALT
ncbi:MAG: helix-turn-helix domain-containing protein [Kordiimonadaceae bacterium]|nr:helix-turn-helix domain-containing protein [Kordiimonadaceae bacterium]MBO6568454.1 helix-turn-helix domain-containing protein [Kordiimonadaceae bacterium]MBO6963817.1 helix-turn-helix domain-containing protein [Kordiimonadaceae bacterium]